MGMFDEVEVPCPKCGALYKAQSKGGPCYLKVYPLYEAPVEVLADITDESMWCYACGTKFHVVVQCTTTIVLDSLGEVCG
jgi:hypothetical protein